MPKDFLEKGDARLQQLDEGQALIAICPEKVALVGGPVFVGQVLAIALSGLIGKVGLHATRGLEPTPCCLGHDELDAVGHLEVGPRVVRLVVVDEEVRRLF